MRFADIIGHDRLKSLLAHSVADGRVSHALLFTGACGYGTLPLAVAYAQYINCTDRRNGDSCGECASCVKISQLAHPDLHFAFPVKASKAGSSQKAASDNFLPEWRKLYASTGGYFDEPMWYSAINIDNQQGIITRNEADEVVRKLSLKSFEAEYKIMIIWQPERMRAEAANALLKILEEPWDKTLFFLVSESPDKLLPTILSRTQEIPVHRTEPEEMERYLSGQTDPERVAAIARVAAGDIITARKLLEDEGSGTREFFGLFTGLMRLSYNDRHLELLEWGETVAALGREEQKRFLVYCVGMLRDSFILNKGMEDLTYLWGEELDFGRKFSPFVGGHNIEPLVAEMEQAIGQITQNGNPRMIFPHLALAVSKLITRR